MRFDAHETEKVLKLTITKAPPNILQRVEMRLFP